jgi:hypothetical protein
MRRRSRSNIAGIYAAATTGTDWMRSSMTCTSILSPGAAQPILCCDLGNDFEHTGDKLLEGQRLGSQRQLVVRAPPHPGLAVPLRPDPETPSLL